MYITIFKIFLNCYGKSIKAVKKSVGTNIVGPLFTAFWTAFITNWIVGISNTNPENLFGKETPGSKSFTAEEIPDWYAPPPDIQIVARMLIIQGKARAIISSSIRVFMVKAKMGVSC
ncbi:MAG: hypothetical protein GY797_36650 [Deltaproteobacteria bacterium]|nr:hypothetical protein [Deltaproteobacteria bacterium]